MIYLAWAFAVLAGVSVNKRYYGAAAFAALWALIIAIRTT